MAIELDDASHRRKSRMERDAFVDSVFEQIGIPLVHIKAARSYDVRELHTTLCEALKLSSAKGLD
ncbi:hypothetical protein Mal64_36090 [Pseudobythopirellula maris]|uniref:DUF2726 domain-containing protein n=2 Tax=Pseudobythopirellula maris TaxID=2527991 RepID=A0A5C5ZH92_9BACT|nr:hypothetical protein Mal64_36090 [Pseudobythopirellula maris]